MGETNPGENDLDDDDSNSGEQNPEEGGNSEDESDENQNTNTDSDDESEEQQPVDESVEEPDTEDVTEAEVPEEVVAEEEEEAEESTTFTGNQTDAIQETKTKIVVKGVALGGEDGKTKVLGDLSTAELQFTNNCASNDGSQVRADVDITFRILSKEGYKVDSVKYGTVETDEALAAAELKTASKALTAKDDIYTIPKGDINKGEKKYHALIVVETSQMKFNVKAGTMGGLTMNTVEEKEVEGESVEELKSFTSKEYEYNDAKSIELDMTGMAAGTTYKVTATLDGSSKALELEAGEEVVLDEAKKISYVPYSLDATALDGVKKYDVVASQNVTINVETIGAVEISGSAVAYTPASYNDKVGAPKLPDDAPETTVVFAENGTYHPGETIVFSVKKQVENSNWAEITAEDIEAKLVKTVDGKETAVGDPLSVSESSGITEEGSTVFEMTIPDEVNENCTLKLAVNAKLNDSAKKIKFTLDLPSDVSNDAVVIKSDDTKIEAGTEYRTADNTYPVSIQSKEGVQIESVTVKVTGTYDGTDGGAYDNGDGVTLNNSDPDDQEYPRYAVEADIALTGTDDRDGDNKGKKWTASDVEVIVKAGEIEGADEKKEVAFVSKNQSTKNGPHPYEIKVETNNAENGKVSYKDGKASIAVGTKYLIFSVKAETEPEVLVSTDGRVVTAEEGKNDNDLLELVSKDGGEIKYRVPAKAFVDTKGKISVTRQKTTIKAVYEENAVVSFKNGEDENSKSYPLSVNVAEDIDINAPLTVEVTREDETAAPIDSVTYKVGKDGAEQTAQSDGDGGFFFEVKATDDITITVNNAAKERLFVNGEEHEAGETIEVAYEEPITAYLKNDKDQKVKLINATVYESAALAETTAKLNADGTEAVIEKVDKAEREKELTVTLLKDDRTAVTFTIVSDKAVEEVTYTRADGTAVSGSVSLNEDTQLTLHVNAADGNAEKMRAVVVETGAKDPEKVPKGASGEGKNLEAAFDENGDLVITAYATDKAIEKAGTILLYEVGDEEAILKGSILNVSVNEPVILSNPTTAAFQSATAKDITISINVPDAVKKEELVSGSRSIYYTLNITNALSTAPEGLTADEWKATKQNINDMMKAANAKVLYRSDINNGYTIPVIGGGKDVKPAKVDGFKIVLTPVQVVGGKEVKGTPCEIASAGTTAPIYSETLKLTGGTKTLITGQDEDVVVAVPNFADIAEYKSVKVEMIDSTTGMPFWNLDKDEFDNGESGFYPHWDAVNKQVTVNAGNAYYTDNAYGSYKNLAVKVTATTETGDYGVSGVVKLSVVNGIQDMSLSVQPEILKADAKRKITVKPTVIYNNENAETWGKKYAPKKKAATFSLYNVSEKLKGNVSIDAKTGQITIEKDFVPSEKAAENQFYVRAEAADYEGNKEFDVTGPITVTAKDSTIGELVIFEAGAGNDWTKATKAATAGGTDLQVKLTSGQYRLAMLSPNAPTKTTYNLNSKDFIDNDLYNITSSSKNVKVDAGTGAITVNKLGKVTLTMAAKSNAKNKKELKNVNFVVENTDLYVQVTEYQDSTFNQKGVIRGRFNTANSIEATGNSTSYFKLSLMKKVTGSDGKDKYEEFALASANCSYAVKNGKKVTPSPENAYDKNAAYVMATGTTGKKATVITVTNKGVKPSQKIEITITNAKAEALAGTAPKIAQTDKKQKLIAGRLNTEKVGFTVTSGKKGEALPDNAYVLLSVDSSKKLQANVNKVFDGSLEKAIPLIKTNNSTATFSLNVHEAYCKAESYNLIATLGTMKDGVFEQTNKDAKITLKASKGNMNIKATTKYTLNPYGASSQKLVVSGGDFTVRYDSTPITQEYKVKEGTKEVTKTVVNYAQNVIQKDGKPNQFNKYFAATEDEDGNIDQIMINPTLSLDELKNLENKDFMKVNGTGYITVTNGAKVADVKLTVAVNGKDKLKLKAAAASVLVGKDVITDVQVLDGKKPVALAAYTAEGGSFKAYFAGLDDKSKKAEQSDENARMDDGVIRMKAAETAKGTDTVNLKVLPKGIAQAYGASAEALATYGIDITGVTVKIEAADKKNKVALSAADKKWKVENSDWSAKAATKDEPARSGWATKKTYTFTNRLGVECYAENVKDSGQVINVTSKVPYVSFTSDRYNVDGVQSLEIFLDKEKLAAAMASDKKVGWGKTVKVDAEFTYPDKTDETKTVLTADKVTFSITLPEEKEQYADGSALLAAIDAAKDSLQELVDVRTQAYQSRLSTVYTNQKLADDVAEDLKAAVLDMAKGTAAVIDAKGGYANNLYTYTLTVDGTSKVFETIGQASAKDVLNALAGYLKLDDVTDDKVREARVKELGLQFRPVTTDDALTKNVKEVLKDKHVLTSNISVSAQVLAEKVKAPTSKVDGEGHFEAYVTVTDRNFEPAGVNSGNYSRRTTMTYTFPVLTASSDYVTLDGTKGLKTKLTAPADKKDLPAVTGMKKIDYLFSEAYGGVENGFDEATGKLTGDMKDAFEAKVKQYAADIIDNPYVTVKEIKDFACDPKQDKTGWNVTFTIVYTDATAEADDGVAEDVDLTFETGTLEVVKAQVPRAQDVNQLMSDADTALEGEGKILKNTTDATAACDAIKAYILEKVSLNPNYKETSLDVKPDTEGEFIAPTTDCNGKIDVVITYDAEEKEPSKTQKKSFIILKNDDLYGESSEEDEEGNVTTKPNLTDRVKYKDLITATLSEKKLSDEVTKQWATFAATNDNTWAKFIDDATVNAALVTAIETEIGKVLPVSATIALADGTPITVSKTEGWKQPADTKTDGTIGTITIKLKDTDTDAEAWKDEDSTITLTGKKLLTGEKFQSEAEFQKTVTDALTDPGLEYSESYFDESGKAIAEMDDAKAAIKTGIETLAKELQAKATNPEWKRTDYTIAADVADAKAGSNTTLSGVKLTFKGTEKTVSVKLRTQDEMPLVKSIKSVTIDSKSATPNEDKYTTQEIQSYDDTKSLALAIGLETTTGGTSEAALKELMGKVTWELYQKDGTSKLSAATDGNVATTITIKDNDAKDGKNLVIDKDAFTTAANGVVEAQLKATVAAADTLEDTALTAAVPLEITLTEKVTKIELKLNGETVANGKSFEAGSEELTFDFTTAVEGSHVNKDATNPTKAVVTIPENLPEGLTLAHKNSDTSTLTMTVATAYADEKDIPVAMKAGKNEFPATVNLHVIGNKKAAEKLKIALNADGMTDAELGTVDGKNVLTVKNTEEKPVRIPITGLEGRTWSIAPSLKVANNQGIADTTGITVETKDGKTNLVIANTVPEILAAVADDTTTDDKDETVPAVTVVLTATSTASTDKSQAALTKTYEFDIVVKKTISKVEIEQKKAEGNIVAGDTEAKYDAATKQYKVVKDTENGNQVTLEATVKGAHVTKSQKVKWTLSKGSKSKATIKDGVLTIPKDSKDNIITVKATTEDKNEDGNDVSGTYTIKVVTE